MEDIKLRIFRGLYLTEQEAKDLALYWKKAGNHVAVIDSNGCMQTSQLRWERPISDSNFKALRDALATCPVTWIIVQENQLVIDFDHLKYNQGWLKKMFKNRGLGVRYQKGAGLKLYQKRETGGKPWYQELEWTLKGVTVKGLKLKKHEIVSLTPNQENPDEAEWKKLYFVA